MINTKIVFLHLPKTAGQTIHAELAKHFEQERVCPIRTFSQTSECIYSKYSKCNLFSGHIHWDTVEKLGDKRSIFSVLRPPKARLASFYFYLKSKAEFLSKKELSRPENTGLDWIKNKSADDYFFPKNEAAEQFIRQNFDNFYLHFFASRRMDGYQLTRHFSHKEKMQLVSCNLRLIEAIFSIENMVAIEAYIKDKIGVQVGLQENKVNVTKDASYQSSANKWELLLRSFEKDRSVKNLEKYVEFDQEIYNELFP